MKKTLKIYVILMTLILSILFFGIPRALCREEKREETINEILILIRLALNRESGAKTNVARMNQWKKNRYEVETLLDRLLNKVDKERTGRTMEFPGKSPFSHFHDRKWKSFRLLLAYRKYLFKTVKEIERGKYGNGKTLAREVISKARYFRGKAMLDNNKDLNHSFNIKDQTTRLISGLEKTDATNEIKKILEDEIAATHGAFIEYKTITNDLKDLVRQYNRVKKYYEGANLLPGLINPQPPQLEKTGTPTPEPSPSPEPSYAPEPTPSPVVHPTPAPAQLKFRILVENPPSSVGDRTKLKVVDITGGTSPYKYIWEVNDRVISSKPAITVRFSHPGKYRLRATIIDSKNRRKTINKSFIISPKTKSKNSHKTRPPSKMSLEYDWSSGYPYIGREVSFRILRVTGGSSPYKFKWTIDGKKIGD